MASPSDEVDLSLSLGNGPDLGRKRKKRDDSNPNPDNEGRKVDFGDRRSGLGRFGFDLRPRGGFDGGEEGKEVSCGGSNPNLKESDGFDGGEVGKKGFFHVQGRRSGGANPNPKPDLVKSNSNPNLKANVVDKSNCVGNLVPCASFPVVTMPCSPFGYPYMVPWWNVPVPAGSEGANVGKNVFQPVAIRGFHHFPGHGVNRNRVATVAVGGGGSDGESNEAKSGSIFRSTSLTPSQGSSFSAVSDFQSGGSGSNSSCDTRAHSNPATDEKRPPNSSFKRDKSLQQPHPIISSEPIEAPRNVDAEPTDSNQASITLNSISRSNSIQKPRSTFVHHENLTTTPVRTNSMPLPEMPCVTTTGNGPNGKTITGFLYRYNKTEVSIVCVCHGSSFSPAEFIKHAGGTEVSHPLRHIVIVPS